MTKQELMENYTVEQLAEMVVELQEQIEVLQEIATEKERKLKSNIISVIVGGIAKEYQIEEIGDIVRAYEEIKFCKEANKECKTILPSEYLKILSLNQTVSELQSEVEKYRKAFEDAKKERDCKIAEYRNRTEKDKMELERAKNTINQINDILEKLFGLRHDTVDNSDELEDVLTDKMCEKVEYFIPERPIEVAGMLIKETGKSCLDKYKVSELRQIAEHLLVYCNANQEEE